jgi:PknH-like extracellular domain
MFGTRVPLMADLHNGVGLAAVVTAGVMTVAGCSSPSKAPAGSPATSAPTSGRRRHCRPPHRRPPRHWTFANLVGDPPKNRHTARGWTCQRVLSAARNAVIDVNACAFKISDQGVQAADKIAAKATQ